MTTDLPTRYDPLSRLFHWAVALLLGVTVPVGIAMTSVGFEEIRDQLFVAHKGLGVVILVVVLLRLGWRAIRRSPAAPEGVDAGEHRMARATHIGLYVLVIGMSVTGYLRTAGGGYPVEILDFFGIGPLVPEFAFADTLSVIHKFGAWLTMSVIVVHVAMVVRHALFGEGRVLRRMWPPIGGSDDSGADG